MNSDELDILNEQVLRNKAEEKLKSKQLNNIPTEEVTDVKELLRELQIHQIELEIQNKELQQAYERAEKALKKFTLLFDLSAMGYFILDPEGSITELNFTGAEMLKERRFSLINSKFALFVSEKSKPIFSIFLKNIFTNKAKESCEIQLGYNDKYLRNVYMEGVVIEDNQKCLLSVVDKSKFQL